LAIGGARIATKESPGTAFAVGIESFKRFKGGGPTPLSPPMNRPPPYGYPIELLPVVWQISRSVNLQQASKIGNSHQTHLDASNPKGTMLFFSFLPSFFLFFHNYSPEDK